LKLTTARRVIEEVLADAANARIAYATKPVVKNNVAIFNDCHRLSRPGIKVRVLN
jgi:hypothetical protein